MGASLDSRVDDFHFWFLRYFDKMVVSNVDLKTGKVEVSLPFSEDFFGMPINGMIRETFDLNHAALLVGLKITQSEQKPNKPATSSEDNLEMRDPIQVDGVWIPTQFLGTVYNQPNQIPRLCHGLFWHGEGSPAQ